MTRCYPLRLFCFHGRDSVREQYQAVNMLLRKMESLETLDITKTNLGAIEAKDLTFNLTLPHLQTLKIQESWLYQDNVMKIIRKIAYSLYQIPRIIIMEGYNEWYPGRRLGQMLFKFPSLFKGFRQITFTRN